MAHALPENLEQFFVDLVNGVKQRFVEENQSPSKPCGCAIIPNLLPVLLRRSPNDPSVSVSHNRLVITESPGWQFVLDGDFTGLTPADESLLAGLLRAACPIANIQVMIEPLHIRSCVSGTDCRTLIQNAQYMIQMMAFIYAQRKAGQPVRTSSLPLPVPDGMDF